jgi:hypothetical protein
MKRYKTLEAWIREALTDTDKDKECTALACIHKKIEGGTKEVHTVKLTGKTHEPGKLAELFRGKAEAFSQDMGGIQKFELQAFYGTNEVQASHGFTIIDGELHVGADRVHKETPDGPGIVAQAMRHAEKAYELATGLIQQVAVTSIQREEKFTIREERLQTEVSDAYIIIRDMLMDKIKQDHAMIMQRLEYERTSQERKRLLDLAPALANTVAGRELFPQSTADTALLDALADKVKPEFIENLVTMGVITPELAGPLSIRLTEAINKKEAERKALKQLPASNVDPAKDAAGEPNVH